VWLLFFVIVVVVKVMCVLLSYIYIECKMLLYKIRPGDDVWGTSVCCVKPCNQRVKLKRERLE